MYMHLDNHAKQVLLSKGTTINHKIHNLQYESEEDYNKVLCAKVFFMSHGTLSVSVWQFQILKKNDLFMF